jgi:ribonuclease HI
LFKNEKEAYALFEGIRIVKSMGIQKLTILGDSMLMIRAIIKRSIIKSNVFTGVLYLSYSP